LYQEIKILYEDSGFLIVCKPSGIAVHHTDGMPHDEPVLLSILGKQLNISLYNVHRLDAKTSGLIVVAKDQDSAKILTSMFESRRVEKEYLALVRGTPPKIGEFNSTVQNKAKGKQVSAITRFEVMETYQTNISYKSFENIPLSLVRIEPQTGRWHQIRQHFAYHRFDILGDNHHGDRMLNHIVESISGVKRLYLHASRLRFVHPKTNETIELQCQLPDEFQTTIQKCISFTP